MVIVVGLGIILNLTTAMSREKTVDEVQQELLAHVRYLVQYWNKVDDRDCKEKLEGLAFSILAMLDGSATDICGFIVAPNPHEDDKKFCIEIGENYYAENADVKCDVAGNLHDLFYEE